MFIALGSNEDTYRPYRETIARGENVFYKHAIPTGLKTLRPRYVRMRQKCETSLIEVKKLPTRRWNSSETINAKNFTHLMLFL